MPYLVADDGDEKQNARRRYSVKDSTSAKPYFETIINRALPMPINTCVRNPAPLPHICLSMPIAPQAIAASIRRIINSAVI
ncbi:hypothetical protein ECZU41_26640 [Escherichia coli]|nr:hypothetical protein ECZU26_09820 [Escherichia coli]GHM07996.1 hypothetical protein ECZU41_26640 [Escherichia coli]